MIQSKRKLFFKLTRSMDQIVPPHHTLEEHLSCRVMCASSGSASTRQLSCPMRLWLITDATSPLCYSHLAAMSQTAQRACGPSEYRRHLMLLTSLVSRSLSILSYHTSRVICENSQNVDTIVGHIRCSRCLSLASIV